MLLIVITTTNQQFHRHPEMLLEHAKYSYALNKRAQKRLHKHLKRAVFGYLVYSRNAFKTDKHLLTHTESALALGN